MKKLLLFMALTLAAGPAAADAVQDYHRMVGAAMKHVRFAQFYLRTGNLAVAGTELDEATAKWGRVQAVFAAKPPGPLARDGAFRADLEAVAAALAAALAAVDGDEQEAAVRHLAPVAGRLAGLRKRNGLWVYADCIAAMNRAMDGAWHYRRKPPDFGDTAQVAEMDRRLAALAHWYRRCYREAGKGERGNPAFERLFKGSFESIERLLRAAADRSAPRMISNLRELKSFDRLIWLYLG